jgi:signal transduction histidine kinase
MSEAGMQLRANRMDLVARWADDLAHEIKNPLHAMVINLELVKRRASAGEAGPLIERIQVVEAELHRVHFLVESLLRLVRPWPDRPTADVAAIFEDIMPVLEARARIRKIGLEHRAGAATVPMPPGHLSLVLLNLVDNAMEASAENDRLATACKAEAGQVRITIHDTGAGLPDQLRDHVFEPGVTGRPGHAGLGLAISRRLVREAGGELTLDPAVGEPGTQATIILPRADVA